MAIQLEKENSKFNIYEQHFLIDSKNDLQTLESEYSCHQGDKAELPDGSYYLRHSDDYQGELWELAKSSGGGGVEVESLSVTENGTYTAEEGKAYSPVNVNVPNSYAAGDEGKVVSNGALVAQTSDSVTENGTVDTTLINSLEVNVPQGGGSLVEEKDVNFIDYDGAILYSYTAEEFAVLTEMPALIQHDGIAQATGWNWSLADAKSQVIDDGGLFIGQEYKKTEIDIELLGEVLSPFLSIRTDGEVRIDWGDGEHNNYTSVGYWSPIDNVSHTYPHSGKYTISITAVSGGYRLNSEQYSSILNSSNSIASSDNSKHYVYSASVQAIRLGDSESGLNKITAYCFRALSSLKSVTIPKHLSLGSDINAIFDSCYSLEKISFSKNINAIGPNWFTNCSALKSVHIRSGIISVGQSAFGTLYCREFMIPASVTTIGNYAFRPCHQLSKITFLSETPPTIGTTVFQETNTIFKIYVPYSADHSVLNAYKTASGWSDYASQIVELSA